MRPLREYVRSLQGLHQADHEILLLPLPWIGTPRKICAAVSHSYSCRDYVHGVP